MQQSQIAGSHIVKVDFNILPAGTVIQAQAVRLVVDDFDREGLIHGGIDAVVVLARKQVDTHDAEDEPKYEADQQHVHDGGDGSQQCIHHNLGMSKHTV